MIAHRLTTLRCFNRIFKLNDKSISEIDPNQINLKLMKKILKINL